MKKLFILTLLVFSTVVSVFAVRGTLKMNAKTNLLKPIHIRIDFDIAAPRFGCDGGFGICKPGIGVGRIAPYTGIQAGATCYFDSGILYMEIAKTDLGASAKGGFIKNTILPIEADIPLDPSIVEALQAGRSITIMQGNYPIKDTGSSYLIALNCK